MNYRAKFDTPSPISEFIQEIQGVGEVVNIGDAKTEITIEARDEYELATIVRELECNLGSMVGHSVDIPRPVIIT